MNKTEATAVNVLMRALTVAPPTVHGDVYADDDPRTVVAAIDTLACAASRALGAGVRQGDVANWHARPPVIPTAPLIDALHDIRALDTHLWFDIAPGWSCLEADEICGFLRALHGDSLADDVMAAHKAGDDETDDDHAGGYVLDRG